MVGIGLWKKFPNVVFLETYSSRPEYMQTQQVNIPVESLIAYCVFSFCSPRRVTLQFVTVDKDIKDKASAVTISDDGLQIIAARDVPRPVASCEYPVVLYDDVILCGLCAVVRHICMYRHGPLARDEHEDGLLGFRQSCLQAPNEASVWTKFCEIDLINSVRHILTTDFIEKVPKNLVRFEHHLRKPVKIHNVYKVARDMRKEQLSPVEEASISQSSDKEPGAEAIIPNAGESKSIAMGSKEKIASEARESKSSKPVAQPGEPEATTGSKAAKSKTLIEIQKLREYKQKEKDLTVAKMLKAEASKSTGTIPKAGKFQSNTTGSKPQECESGALSKEKESDAVAKMPKTEESKSTGTIPKADKSEPKATGAVPKLPRKSKSSGEVPKSRNSEPRTTVPIQWVAESKSTEAVPKTTNSRSTGTTLKRSKSTGDLPRMREFKSRGKKAGRSVSTAPRSKEKESGVAATVSEAIESVASFIFSAFNFIEEKVSKIASEDKKSEGATKISDGKELGAMKPVGEEAAAMAPNENKTGAIPKVPKEKERLPKNRKWKSKKVLIDPSRKVSDLIIAHTFAEGPFLTLADLVLLPSFHIAIQSFGESKYQSLLPFTYKWYKKVMSIKALHIYTLIFRNMAVKPLSYNEIEIPEVENVSLYKSDPKRSNPKKRLFTKPAEIQEALGYITPGMELNMKDNNLQFTINWDEVPDYISPSGGILPEERVVNKKHQLENIITSVITMVKVGDIIVDFCCGCGHLGVLLAHMLPHCTVILLENKEEALFRAKNRATCLNLKNCFFYQCNLDFFKEKFDIGIGLHACGVATDLILDKCLEHRAKFVLTPCCYGSIHATDRLKYPRSKKFSHVPIDKYLCLSHTADQTHYQSPLAGRGARCMIVIDSDRGRLAEECGYEVTLSRLKPPTCTPKNNLLIGIPLDTVKPRH